MNTYSKNGLSFNQHVANVELSRILHNVKGRGIPMRCQACDCELSDYEATRKDSHGVYLDLCSDCYFTVRDEVPSTARKDLETVVSIVSEEIPEISGT